MYELEIVFHVIKRVSVVVGFEQTTEAGGDGGGLGSAFQTAGLRQEPIHSRRTWLVNVSEPFPFHAEAHDGFVNRVVLVTIHLFLTPMVLCQIVQKPILLAFRPLQIFYAVGHKEFFCACVIRRLGIILERASLALIVVNVYISVEVVDLNCHISVQLREYHRSFLLSEGEVEGAGWYGRRCYL